MLRQGDPLGVIVVGWAEPGPVAKAQEGLLKQFAEQAIMGNVGNSQVVLEMGEVQAAARTLGLDVITSEIRRAEDIAPAFEAFKGRADALFVILDPVISRTDFPLTPSRCVRDCRRCTVFGTWSKRAV